MDDASETVEDYSIKNEITIKLPNELKQVLADDYHIICVQNKVPAGSASSASCSDSPVNSLFISKLVTIPAFNSVDSILEDYLEYKLDKQFDK